MGKLRNALIAFSDVWRGDKEKDLSKQSINTKPNMRKIEPAANEKLLKAIYKGSDHNFALASYLSTGMVDVPKNMVGIPGIIPNQRKGNGLYSYFENEAENLIKEIIPLMLDDYPLLISTMLITGTAWIMPKWSDKLKKLVWEMIPDSSVTSIIMDLDTGEISEVWIDEDIEYMDGETSYSHTNKKRHITRSFITEIWKGKINKNVCYENRFNILPIPFGHNCLSGEWRGSSVFSKALRHMKSYHDIEYKRDTILATFNPKIIQTVKSDKNGVQSWISNNTKDEKFDPYDHDFYINQEGESTQFLSLTSDATSQHLTALNEKERKIIKSSGIPELFFGALATGNHASTDADCRLAIEYIKSIRRELTKGTQELVNQSLKILAYMKFTQPPEFSIQWGNLSLLSEMQKALIMGQYASAICQLLSGGSVTKEGAFYFTKELYPEYPADNAENFFNGLVDTPVDQSKPAQKELTDELINNYFGKSYYQEEKFGA